MAGETIYSVFVSSTYEDLREERAAVQKALLQLHCMPIGMELFGSADEETWDFIKRQIDDCDYYVVILADKYGSTADDGVSYTEKEYDYARKIRKPVIGFVHRERNSIRRDKTEIDPVKRPKLEAFIQKVRHSPVSFFTSPDDLATQVTVSFVRLRERHPAVGFIRADQVPDLRKYADLLEEVGRLHTELERKSRQQALAGPFAQANLFTDVRAIVQRSNGLRSEESFSQTWGQVFISIAEKLLVGYEYYKPGLEELIERQVRGIDTGDTDVNVRLLNDEDIALQLIKWGLLHPGGRSLTDYGREQYNILTN